MRSAILVAALLLASPASALTPEAWRHDLAVLRQSYIETHPNPFHKLPREAFDREADALATDIPKLDDAGVIARMIVLVASVGEGHTRLTLPLAGGSGVFLGHATTEVPKVAPFTTLPIRLTATSDGYVVTAAAPAQGALLNAELVSIDGHPVSEIEKTMLPLVHGDNPGMRHADLPDFLIVPELLHAEGIARDPHISIWRFRLRDGRKVEQSLAPVAPDTDTAWATAAEKQPKLQLDTRNPDFVYARIAEIANQPGQSLAQFADTMFAAVDAMKEPCLVVDLRGNPGGNNFLIDPIVRGAIARPALWKPGRLFVLIDAGTFSAAQNLVNAFERWTPALFVGSPTGAAPSSYGDSKRIVLPESGLTLRVSSLYWQDTGPLDKRDATAPQVPAARTVADLQTGRDPALAAVRALSQPQGTPEGDWAAPVTYVYKPATMRVSFHGGSGSFSVPELGLKDTPFQAVSRSGDLVTARASIKSSVFTIMAQATAGGLAGYFDVDGRPYPFVAQRVPG